MFFNQIFQSISDFVRATAFLSRHKLLYYYLFPIVLSIIYYTFMVTAFYTFSQFIVTTFFGEYLAPIDQKISGFKSFWSAISVAKIAVFATYFLIFFLGTKISKYVVLIILSPVFSLLSEKVDEIITGRQFPFSFIQLMKDLLRGSIIAVRNMFIELFLIGLLTLFSLFSGPFIFLLAPVLFIVGAYFYGFSMMDYTCERKKFTVGQSIEFIRQNRGIALGNGIMYSLIDFIPFVGLVVSPINGVVGATLSILEEEKNYKQ